ncbi:MAG TPA: response regulator [Stenomitos sp.]
MSEKLAVSDLFYELKQSQVIQASGKMSITSSINDSTTWDIYLYLGRVIWATSSVHRNKRWLRILKQHCPTLISQAWMSRMVEKMNAEQGTGSFWEVQILSEAIQEQVLSPERTKNIITSYIQEILFGIVAQPDVQSSWITSKDIPQQLTLLDVDQIIESTTSSCNQWQQLLENIGNQLPSKLSLDLAPIIRRHEVLKEKISPSVYEVLSKLLTGKNTVWDITSGMQKPLVPFISSLIPLIQDGVIDLVKVADIVFPGQKPVDTKTQKLTIAEKSAPSKGLIACIDDSPVIGQQLEDILKPAGYEVLRITDPVQNLVLLLKKQPNLIFLDLVMPNTNGYEICSFLRKTAVFKDIPIVMLTGHDGVIDRLRAKMVGSTDFLSKPPDPTKVVQVVQKLVGGQTETETPAERMPRLNEQPVLQNGANHQVGFISS